MRSSLLKKEKLRTKKRSDSVSEKVTTHFLLIQLNRIFIQTGMTKQSVRFLQIAYPV